MFIELLIRIRNSCDENNFQSEVYDEIIRFTSNPELIILSYLGNHMGMDMNRKCN